MTNKHFELFVADLMEIQPADLSTMLLEIHPADLSTILLKLQPADLSMM